MRALPLASFLAPGMRLGNYQLVRQLAIGGMAEVYIARAKAADGDAECVVLKRILPRFATNPDFVRMFLNEARIASSLDHPNIARVHEVGQMVGNYYFTMEYIPGADLRAVLQREHRARRRLPLEVSVEIARGLAAGLHHAHEQRDADGQPLDIIHRDVSLSNVLVSYDGEVKLVDFGVAKCAMSDNQTRAGTLKGKLSYMSPEQCRGEPLDRRSDVFSLGIVIYELTTGTRLYTGDNEFAIMEKIATRDVEPPSERVPGYPAALEHIVLQALRRDRDERYATAGQMQADLDAFVRDAAIEASPLAVATYLRDAFADEVAEMQSDDTISRRLRALDLLAGAPAPALEEPDDAAEVTVQEVRRPRRLSTWGEWLRQPWPSPLPPWQVAVFGALVAALCFALGLVLFD